MQAVPRLLLNNRETGSALCLHCLGLSHQPPSPWGLVAGLGAWGEGTILNPMAPLAEQQPSPEARYPTRRGSVNCSTAALGTDDSWLRGREKCTRFRCS